MATAAAHRGTRVRRNPQHARDVIVRAAASVFVHKGFHGATIDDVAAQAGYSAAAVYKYFRNKDALYGELWAAVAKRLDRVFAECNSLDLPFAERLRWLVTRLALWLESEPEPLGAFLAHRPFAARVRSPFERQALRHYRSELAQLERLMADGVSEGALRPGDCSGLALLLLGLLYEFAHRWATSEERLEVPAQIERLLELFHHGAGRRTDAPRGGTGR